MSTAGTSQKLFIGLMSGTSLDGVDGVLADFSVTQPRVLAHHAMPFAPALKQELLALNTPSDNELHRAALAANGLVRVYAQTVQALLTDTQTAAGDICAIGAHGQTVRHQPGAFDGTGYTLQLNNPALLAELTGIDVVADFRSRDVAAGGQGAPLVPVFHQGIFGQANRTVGVLNIGGIANLSVLHANGDVLGFDCGPGNALLDHWCQAHTGAAFDNNGTWGASGNVIEPLLQAMLAEPFLHQAPPKSTGRDLFHPTWLAHQLSGYADANAADVQATLTEFTARACVNDVLRHAADASELIVCGGGALNGLLMQRLQAGLTHVRVLSSAERGMPPLQVEAAAFAWLARQTVLSLPGNLPKVTGAQGTRILGGIFKA
ncbi:anhydro-N-acetylmuramic acid kinase [Limnohabitans sp. Jir61]|uniref:anhydro-N-acetylmuramic acid kinase n=1 Tax=Limnohabitans sp. Jir61 TaxID=1826168 RepID=UPI000D3D2592|nr:anhydro-N-acetylmuramic acid kinase [Limnohabitans sp. Jir61]PUE32061.1 anhydro-N-acetylmuramic acid kinase [Limnohabitans sp. Jir61]